MMAADLQQTHQKPTTATSTVQLTGTKIHVNYSIIVITLFDHEPCHFDH